MGRAFRSTPAQRRRVFKLLDEGLSHRAIADKVFGDARFRGRVGRLAEQRRVGEGFSVAELEQLTDEELAELVEQRLDGGPATSEPEENAPAAQPEPPPAAPKEQSFEQKTAELEALTRATKARIAADLANGKTNAGQLKAVARLEIAIENRRQFARLRDMTRER